MRLNAGIKEARANIVKGKFLGSAFIRCNLQMGAHVLAQCVSYHEVGPDLFSCHDGFADAVIADDDVR